MKLLPNESEIISLKESGFILTNYRIQKRDSDWGESNFVSIFLEDISSIESKYSSNIIFIFFAVLSVIAGFLLNVMVQEGQGGSGRLIYGVLLGGIFLALWWFTRKHIILICSNGGSPLKFLAKQMSKEQIYNLIHEVSIAKQKRVNLLFNQEVTQYK